MLIVFIALAAAALIFVGSESFRHRRRSPELDDNWWPEFERALRDYERELQGRQTPTRE